MVSDTGLSDIMRLCCTNTGKVAGTRNIDALPPNLTNVINMVNDLNKQHMPYFIMKF